MSSAWKRLVTSVSENLRIQLGLKNFRSRLVPEKKLPIDGKEISFGGALMYFSFIPIHRILILMKGRKSSKDESLENDGWQSKLGAFDDVVKVVKGLFVILWRRKLYFVSK